MKRSLRYSQVMTRQTLSRDALITMLTRVVDVHHANGATVGSIHIDTVRDLLRELTEAALREEAQNGTE